MPPCDTISFYLTACSKGGTGVDCPFRKGKQLVDTKPEGINKLCARCVRRCKQPTVILMLECPRFQQRPFKSEEFKFQQLDLFGEKKG